jgi:hypothetical protein
MTVKANGQWSMTAIRLEFVLADGFRRPEQSSSVAVIDATALAFLVAQIVRTVWLARCRSLTITLAKVVRTQRVASCGSLTITLPKSSERNGWQVAAH